MKSKDFTLLVVIGIVSGFLSLLFSNFFLAPAENRKTEVEVVEPIVSEFNRPSKDYYNDTSLNPTQTIRIRQETNTNPFGGQ
jgi:hypothetical protein